MLTPVPKGRMSYLLLLLLLFNPFIPTVPYSGRVTGHISLFSLLVILISG